MSLKDMASKDTILVKLNLHFYDQCEYRHLTLFAY